MLRLFILHSPPSAAPVLGRLPDSMSGEPPIKRAQWSGSMPVGRQSAEKPVVLDQRNVQFVPQVLAVQVGTKVSFPNNDRVFHNVFSFRESKRFDLGLYPVGMVKEVPFDKPGLSRVYCNIHPQMAAYVMVVDTPYFAVSDATGRFTIAAVPAGTYPYHAWYPGGTILNDTFTVAPDASLEVRWK